MIAHVVVYGDGQRYLVAGVWVRSAAVERLSPDEMRERVQARITEANATLARH